MTTFVTAGQPSVAGSARQDPGGAANPVSLSIVAAASSGSATMTTRGPAAGAAAVSASTDAIVSNSPSPSQDEERLHMISSSYASDGASAEVGNKRQSLPRRAGDYWHKSTLTHPPASCKVLTGACVLPGGQARRPGRCSRLRARRPARGTTLRRLCVRRRDDEPPRSRGE